MIEPHDYNAVQPIARRIAKVVARIPGVAGVTLGGSAVSGLADAASDIDLHVYWRGELAPPDTRAAALISVADEDSIVPNILTWGLEDHLRVDGRLVELVYVQLDELRTEIERAYGEGLISEAFTTARLYYLVHSEILSDTAGELAELRTQLKQAYPEPTRQLLLRYYPELLRYGLANVRKGQQRDDMPYVLQLRSSMQAVYFNLLFALNRRYHPGEKRLLVHAASLPLLPPNFAERWRAMTCLSSDDRQLPNMLEALITDFERLLQEHP